MPGHLSWEEITGTTFNDMIHLFASSGTSEAAPPLFQVGAFIHVSGLAATCIHAEKVCYTPSHVSGSDFLSCFFFFVFFLYINTFVCQKLLCHFAPWPTVNVTWLQVQRTIVLLNELWPFSQSLSLSLTPSFAGAFHPGPLAVSPYAQVGLP